MNDCVNASENDRALKESGVRLAWVRNQEL